MISIGLIGCGKWGKFILRDLRKLGCVVHVVARSNASKQRAIEGKAASVVSKIEDLPNVDGFVVVTPASTHASVLRKLIAKREKAPIFCEKPLTCDVISARKLVKAAGERLFVMHKWRYHPGIEVLGQIARTKKLGKVIGIKITRTGYRNFAGRDNDTAWHLLPHDLSIVIEILGKIPKPKLSVADEPSDIGALFAVLGTKPFAVIEISERSSIEKREFELYCERGVASLTGSYNNYIDVIKPNGKKQKIKTSNKLPLFLELSAFVDYLKGGQPPKSDAKEALLVVETVAKLRQMAKTN